MNNVIKCRRTVVALFGILALTVLGIVAKLDTASAIAAIAMTISSANAAQAVFSIRGVKPPAEEKAP